MVLTLAKKSLLDCGGRFSSGYALSAQMVFDLFFTPVEPFPDPDGVRNSAVFQITIDAGSRTTAQLFAELVKGDVAVWCIGHVRSPCVVETQLAALPPAKNAAKSLFFGHDLSR
jgi:hypothetical protein